MIEVTILSAVHWVPSSTGLLQATNLGQDVDPWRHIGRMIYVDSAVQRLSTAINLNHACDRDDDSEQLRGYLVSS